MSEKFRLDRKIGLQNMFYTKCINVIVDSIVPSINLRSIHYLLGTKYACADLQSKFMLSLISKQNLNLHLYLHTLPVKHQYNVSESLMDKTDKLLKTYAAISNAHLFRVCKRGKLSGSCLSTLNGFGSTQLPIICHIGVPTFSSQNN